MGKIYCSSIITILRRQKSLYIPPLEGLQELKGSRYLDMAQMVKMQFFKAQCDSQLRLKGTNHYEYLYLFNDDHDLMSLNYPIKDTFA